MTTLPFYIKKFSNSNNAKRDLSVDFAEYSCCLVLPAKYRFFQKKTKIYCKVFGVTLTWYWLHIQCYTVLYYVYVWCQDIVGRKGHLGRSSFEIYLFILIWNVASLPNRLSLHFCCNTPMVEAQFGVMIMKAQIHPAVYQQIRLVVMV